MQHNAKVKCVVIQGSAVRSRMRLVRKVKSLHPPCLSVYLPGMGLGGRLERCVLRIIEN